MKHWTCCRWNCWNAKIKLLKISTKRCMSAHRLPLAGLKVSVFTGLNAQTLFISGLVRWDWIYEHLCGANNLVSRDYEMPFFIQGGLGPPEFRRAFLTGKKVPPWKKISAPLKEKQRPPEKSNPPANLPPLTKSVTWDTGWRSCPPLSIGAATG